MWSRCAPSAASSRLYSNWREGTLTVEAAGQEFELYDYASPGGQLELLNSAGAAGALEEELWVTLEEQALPGELRAPLPTSLHVAQRRGFANYESVEELRELQGLRRPSARIRTRAHARLSLRARHGNGFGTDERPFKIRIIYTPCFQKTGLG